MYHVTKRIFDIAFCMIALPFFLVIYLLVGIAIKLDDNGPILYKAPRIGKDSRQFNMLKFRSMRENSENILNPDGSTYNAKNDQRVTRVGCILRESSIDEIPQILNVLKGDMSIIGPRASGWEALPTYQIDEMEKMTVRPGITGFTQAYYRNGLTVREKRLKDAWYANNVSLLLDIKIFFRTILTIIRREYIYTNTENETITRSR